MEIRRDDVLGLQCTRNITKSDEWALSVEVVEVEDKAEVVNEESGAGSANISSSMNGEKARPKQHPRQKQVGGMIIGAEEVADLANGFNALDLSKTATDATSPRHNAASSNHKDAHDEAVPDSEPKYASLADEPSSATPPKNEKNKTDPIHMFGVLAPPVLRQAQGSFVQAVVGSVSRLVELDGEMRELEIEIRRTRKTLAKQV